MTEARSYSKEQQLGTSRKKPYRRSVASAKKWAALHSEKQGPCRVCKQPYPDIELHHIVPRVTPWFGDDVADNLVPLDPDCHNAVTRRLEEPCKLLLESLTDEEYAYAVQRGGEDFLERYYRIEDARG